MHALRHLAQRQRHAPEGKSAQQPSGQQRQQGAGGQAPACMPHAGLRGHSLAGRAVQHHVQVARWARVTGAWRKHRGAEHVLCRSAGCVHGVGAPQRQRRALQEAAHGGQVHLGLLHHAGLADVMRHAAVGVEQVDVYARVHEHQHAQQGRTFGLRNRAGRGRGRRRRRGRRCRRFSAHQRHCRRFGAHQRHCRRGLRKLRPACHDVPRQPMRKALQ